MLRQTGALVLVLALIAGVFLAVGSLRARRGGEQATFVVGWTLMLLSSLELVMYF